MGDSWMLLFIIKCVSFTPKQLLCKKDTESCSNKKTQPFFMRRHKHKKESSNQKVVMYFSHILVKNIITTMTKLPARY